MSGIQISEVKPENWAGQMLDGITPERILAMTDQEHRWLNNVKKAFLASDEAYASGTPEDRCMEELCKAIDTAKTLQRSLSSEDTSGRQNKARYLEFLAPELPSPEDGGLDIPLLDVRTGKAIRHSFASLIYDIRCMIHENENLTSFKNVCFARSSNLVFDLHLPVPTYERRQSPPGIPVPNNFLPNSRPRRSNTTA